MILRRIVGKQVRERHFILGAYASLAGDHKKAVLVHGLDQRVGVFGG